MEVNWYRRAAETLRYTNFTKAPLRWTSQDNPPYDLIVDLVNDKFNSELFFFLNNVDTYNVRSARARLFINLGEDFIVDEDHSVSMRFYIDFRFKVHNDVELGQLSGRVKIPVKYVPEFKDAFADKQGDLLKLEVEFDYAPPPAVELRTKRKRWK